MPSFASLGMTPVESAPDYRMLPNPELRRDEDRSSPTTSDSQMITIPAPVHPPYARGRRLMLSAALGAFLGVVIVLTTWRAMGSASTSLLWQHHQQGQ
jgi:hypothetical protein